MARVLALVAALAVGARAVLPPFEFNVEIKNPAMWLEVLPPNEGSSPFQALVGHAQDAEQRQDKAYIPEPESMAANKGGKCFPDDWRLYKARSSCQLCSIFIAHLYDTIFTWLLNGDPKTGERIRFAESPKEPYEASEEDYTLSAELFVEGADSYRFSPKMEAISRDLVDSARDLVYHRYCHGAPEVFGVRSKNTIAGGYWDPKYCGEALDRLRDIYLDRRIVEATLMGCFYKLKGGSGARGTQDHSSFLSAPLACPIRVLCSCAKRCPDGGASPGLGDGCSDSCAKCTATGALYGKEHLLSFFRSLEWSLRNLEASSPRASALVREAEQLKALASDLEQNMRSVQRQYDETLAQLSEATGGASVGSTEVVTQAMSWTISQGEVAQNPQLSCSWEPVDSPDGFPGVNSVPAAEGKEADARVKLSPEASAVVATVTPQTDAASAPAPPRVVATAPLEVELSCKLDFDVALSVSMTSGELRTRLDALTWPSRPADVPPPPSPPAAPAKVPSTLRVQTPECSALSRLAASAGVGAARAASNIVDQTGTAPILLEGGKDPVTWLKEKAIATRGVYAAYMSSLSTSVAGWRRYVAELRQQLRTNGAKLQAAKAEAKTASTVEDQREAHFQTFQKEFMASAKGLYGKIQEMSQPVLASVVSSTGQAKLGEALASPTWGGAEEDAEED